MADKKQHLPMMGVGPIYGAVIIAITVISVIAEKISRNKSEEVRT